MVFNSIVYYSLNFTQVISGVLMISTIPVMIMLFSSILKIEKTNIFQIIGLIIFFCMCNYDYNKSKYRDIKKFRF